MSSFLRNLRKQISTTRSCHHRRLRAEALEGRLVLAPVAAVPVSIVLLGPSSGVTPPDPCLQLNPQPILAASLQPGTNSASLSWQGHFTEQLREPSATPTASGATPAAWLVDVVYNLTGQLPAASAGATFDVKGTASEKLTPLDAAGNVISTAKTWVSTDKIESHFAVVGDVQVPAAAFKFVTDTGIDQTLTPLAATVANLQSWHSTIVSHATGTITEILGSADPTASPQAGLVKGTMSLQDHIDATLSPVVPAGSTVPVSMPWRISADFDGTGAFNETLPPAATTATAVGLDGTLALTGTLSETITPPGSSLTALLKTSVLANVSFSTTTDTPLPDPSVLAGPSSSTPASAMPLI
ncbi:MAG: hypothetical protein WCB27_05645 [Thermoguttaceae bacterium]